MYPIIDAAEGVDGTAVGGGEGPPAIAAGGETVEPEGKTALYRTDSTAARRVGGGGGGILVPMVEVLLEEATVETGLL
jgi:hypothetical protein